MKENKGRGIGKVLGRKNMEELGIRNKNEGTRNIYFIKHEIMIIGRSGLLSQEQKKTFEQK